MKPAFASALPLLCLALTACKAMPTSVPAVLISPDAAARQELKQGIQTLSGFASVALLETDLTESSELLIERTRQHDGVGNLIQGRNLEAPQRFELRLQDGQCWIQLMGAGKQQRLKLAQCRAKP